MSQKQVEHVFVVIIVSLAGLFFGSQVGGFFGGPSGVIGGIVLMIAAGIFCHRRIDLFL